MLVRAWCPYCGEGIDIAVDESFGDFAEEFPETQEYVEDCPVCCRPMQVRASFTARGEPRVELLRDDEA